MAKSIRQQIEDKQAAIAKLNIDIEVLTLKLDTEVNTAQIVPGSLVVFQYGKTPNRRELSGVVVGVKPADPANNKTYPQAKVAVGEGFDADIVVVPFASITAVADAPAA